MRLHEAIRLGAMNTEQGFGPLSITSDTAPCALGAARHAAGIFTTHLYVYNALMARWPVLGTYVVFPIKDGGWRPTLVEAIYTLNDTFRWSREQIADWVEGVELEWERSQAQAQTQAQAQPAPMEESTAVTA